jgi:hypothetical protein
MLLTIDDITRIFTGKIKPEIIDNEYNNLFNVKHIKSLFTNEQQEFIIKLASKQKFYSSKEIQGEFVKKYLNF